MTPTADRPLEPGEDPRCADCQAIGCACPHGYRGTLLRCRCGWEQIRIIPRCRTYLLACPRCGKTITVE